MRSIPIVYMHHASLNPTYFSDDSYIVLVVIRAHTVTLCVDIQATSNRIKSQRFASFLGWQGLGNKDKTLPKN